MSCDLMPSVTTKALLIDVMPQPAVRGFRVIVAMGPDTVKLAISEAFKTFADTGLPKSVRAGLPQAIAMLVHSAPIHAILFFLSFLVNYYPTAVAYKRS